MTDEPRRFSGAERVIIALAVLIGVAFAGFLIVTVSLIWPDSRELNEEGAFQSIPSNTTGETAPDVGQTAEPNLSNTIGDPLTQVPLPTAPVFSTPTPNLILTQVAEVASETSTSVAADVQPTITPLPLSKFPRPVSEDQVETVLASLSLEQKIGQMLMVGLPGTNMNSVAERRIVEQGVGGVIFLDRNVASNSQLRDFTQSLQAAAIQQGSSLPLFIGWNHEGGDIVRRTAGLTMFPSNRAQGETGRPDMVYDIGRAVGAEMASLGVNMNFAPVMDVNTEPANPVIGLRSYGETPEIVSTMGQQFILGQQAAGIIAVAKHFPGHGSVDIDSHLELPVLDASLEQLRQGELQAFEAALESNVGGVMVAHLRVPQLDPAGWPTSLSEVVTGDLLRDEMAYEGVVMTDALEMNAIVDNYDLGQAAVQAVLAGNDLLLTVETDSNPDIIRQALLTAVQNGTIDQSIIDDGVRRLIRLKLAYDIGGPPSGLSLPNPANRQLAHDAGMAAVQMLQDAEGWLPLNLPTNSLILISPTKLNPGSAVGDSQSGLGQALANRGVNVTELFYEPTIPADVAETQSYALSLAESADAYVVVTWDAALHYAQTGDDSQANLVTALLATGKPVIAVFGHLPYDSQRLPEAPSQMAMYGDTDGQLLGAVRWLLGEG